MSSSQQTTNLGLPIYGDSDVPSWKDTNTPFQTLDDIIGQGGGGSNVVPLLDFANAVDIGTTNVSTPKDGCLIISGYNNGTTKVYINDVEYSTLASNAGTDTLVINYIPKNTSIRVAQTSATFIPRFVPYLYQSVDPVIIVYNEAEVTLNYTTPLYDFSNGTSYTCVKKCWLVGTMNTDNGLTINGKTYGVANTTNGSAQLFLPLSAGDIVTISATSSFLKVLEGTVSGSVGALGEPTLNYTTPLKTFNTNDRTFTATKECWLIGTYLADAASSWHHLYVNNTKLASSYHTNGIFNTAQVKYKLSAGDVVTMDSISVNASLQVLESV